MTASAQSLEGFSPHRSLEIRAVFYTASGSLRFGKEPRPMVLQALLNGLVDASVIVLAAMGLSLIYGVKKFPNFAHGDMMTVGAYFTLWATSTFRAGILVGIVAAVIFVAILAVFFEFLIFSRLEGRGALAPLLPPLGPPLLPPNFIRGAFWAPPLTHGIPPPASLLSDACRPRPPPL